MFLMCASYGNRHSQLTSNPPVELNLGIKYFEFFRSSYCQLQRNFFVIFAFLFLFMLPKWVQASPLVNHATGNATTGSSYWNGGGGCSGCHGTPPSQGSFTSSTTAFASYAHNPPNIGTGAAAQLASMGQTNVNNATNNEYDLSAYFAEQFQPVLAGLASLTLNPGATWPASHQIMPNSGSDYLVNTTTYGATNLPTGVTLSSGVISGTVSSSLTIPYVATVSLSATNSPGGTGSTSFNLVVKAIQNIVLGAAPSVVVGGTGTVTVSSSGGSGNAVTFSTSSSTCTVNASSGLVTGVHAGLCMIKADQAAGGNYVAASQVTLNITVGQGSQSIGFGAAPTVVVGGTGAVSATSNAGLAVTYSTASSACSVGASSGVVTGITAGTQNCVITASQSGSSDYAAATPVNQTLDIGKGSQSIVFGTSPSISVGGSGTVSATGGASGNPVTFSSTTTSVCTTSGTNGSTVTGVSAGTCTINADQASSAQYNAASQVQQSFSIGQGGQTVTFGTAPSGVVVGGTGTVSATASSGLAISSYTSNTPSTCSVASATGVVTGLASGTNNCTIQATQNGNGSYSSASNIQTFSIGQGSQTISFGTAPSVAVGGTGSVSATASSGLAVTYSTSTPSACSVNASSGQVTGIAAGSSNCTIAANQAGNANYTPASQATQSISIGQGAQTISFGSAPSVSVNGTGSVSATATSSLAVTYSSLTTSACSVNATSGLVTGISAGTNNCTIAANQSGNTNFAAAPQQTQTFSIGIAAQSITFGSAPTVTQGGTGTVTATASSGLAVVFSTSSTACSVNPTTGLVQGITIGSSNCTIAANQSGNANFSAAPQVTQTFSIGAAPPVVREATIHVQLNTSTTIDLSPYISGSGVTGVKLVWTPTHGTATVGGTKVYYVSTTNYFGEDSFSYSAFGTAGTSSVAVVKIVIDGRPDLSQDAAMTGMMRAQLDTSSRFSQAQLTNVEQRFDALHTRMNVQSSRIGSSFGSASSGLALQPSTTLQSLADASNQGTNKYVATYNSTQQPTNGFSADIPKLAYQVNDNVLSDSSNAQVAQLLGGSVSNALISALQTGSFNLAALNNVAAASQPNAPDAIEIWMSGNIKFGSFNNGTTSGFSNFRTDGVTIGADKAINKDLTVGAALGYAFDRTTMVNDESKIQSQGISLALYASYFPVENVFVDGLLGYGTLKVDGKRYVSAIGQYADSTRRGDQIFASISSGYEWRKNGWMLSPYGRLDASYNRLDETTESGVGNFAIHYDPQDSTTAKASVGLKLQAMHQASFGIISPRAKIEYQNRLVSSSSATVQYADQLGTSYQIQGSAQNNNSVVFGVGADVAMKNGVKINLDYQTLRSVGFETSQAVSIRIAKELGGNPMPIPIANPEELTMPTLGVRVDLGYTYDDNINRSKVSVERLNDRLFTMNLTKSTNIPTGEHTRLVLTGFGGVEKAYSFRGLDKVSGGGQAEFQYRSSGDYSSPIYGLFGRVSTEQFNSQYRDGFRYSAGLTFRKPWTDKINSFAAISYLKKDAKESTFDTEEYSARANLDYMLSNESTIYLTGEYRHGDIVSTGAGSLANLDGSRAHVVDDVFVKQGFVSYRFGGDTILSTIGFNYALGPTDGIDISWRRAQSTPTSVPSYVGQRKSYIDNQYSIVYLVRF